MGDASDLAPRVFRVPLDWVLPDLGRVVPAGGRLDVAATAESRSFYDTPAGDLEAAGVLLSRRAGEAWRLVVDGVSVSVPAAGRGVPAQIRDELLGVRAGAALGIVRRVDSDRSTHVVLDAEGAEVGEVADVREHVATTGPAATVAERRHVEVAGWDGRFLADTARYLRKSGAVPIGSAPEQDAPATVGATLLHYLRDRRRDVLRRDLALRRGDLPVHAMRIAVRQLRSALRVIDVTEAAPRAALDAELSWFAGLLGEVRDREVLRSHLGLDGGSDAPTGGASLEAAVGLVRSVLQSEEAAARAELAAAMAGRRYLALLRSLRDWSTDPPLTAAAAKPAARLAGYVDRARRRMDKRLARGARSADDDDDLHRARRAAKRARYAANLAVPVVGKPARKAAKSAKRIQQKLGDHQDAVVAAAFLQRVAADADGEAAFACGALWAREQAEVDRLRRRATR